MRRRCSRCGKLTEKWQRINGGPWHCYDGCYSTTGYDRRTEDLKGLIDQVKKLQKEQDQIFP